MGQKVSILTNKTSKTYYVRLEFESALKMELIDRKGLSEEERNRLLEYFKCTEEYDELVFNVKLECAERDREGWSDLEKCIRKYNENLPTQSDWRKYDASTDRLLKCSREECEELNRYFENDILKIIESDIEPSRQSSDSLKSIIKEDIAKEEIKNSDFILYRCECGKYSILKKVAAPICNRCKAKLNDIVLRGSLEECTDEFNRLTSSQIKDESEDEVFILYGRRYHSSIREDVIRLHKVMFDNFAVNETFKEDERTLSITFTPKFKFFIDKSPFKKEIEGFGYDYLTDNLESSFLLYLAKFEELLPSKPIGVHPVIPYKGRRLETIKEYLEVFLEDQSIYHFYKENYFYTNFFKAEKRYKANEYFSSLFYSELKKFAFYKEPDLVVLPDNLLKLLIVEENKDKQSLYRNFIADYLSNFFLYPGNETSFSITDFDAMNVTSFSDYDALSYFDYLLSGKKVFKYRSIAIGLSYLEPQKYQEQVFETLRDIYVYSSGDSQKEYEDFLKAVSSEAIKQVLGNEGKELYQTILEVKDSGDPSILNMYLSICPKIDLKNMEFNLSGNRGTLVDITKSVSMFGSEVIKNFVTSRDIEKILSKADDHYKEFKNESKEEFISFLNL